jgi:hypothetical protein
MKLITSILDFQQLTLHCMACKYRIIEQKLFALLWWLEDPRNIGGPGCPNTCEFSAYIWTKEVADVIFLLVKDGSDWGRLKFFWVTAKKSFFKKTRMPPKSGAQLDPSQPPQTILWPKIAHENEAGIYYHHCHYV